MNISWVFDGSDNLKLPGMSTMVRPKLNMLFIDSVSWEHTGNYTCKATNRAGTITYSAVLGVHGIYNFIEKVLLLLLLENWWS